jgi:hypothetical protein
MPEAVQEKTQEAPRKTLSLLASEAFGSNFVGEVKKEEPTAEEPKTEEKETPDVEGQGAKEPEEPKEKKLEETKEEEVPISSFDELIKHYELDPEWAQTLKVPVKVNGEAREATLSELVNSYRTSAAAEERLTEAKARASAAKQEFAQKESQLQGQLAAAAKLIEGAEKALEGDLKSVDWAKLRDDDPAEYSARKTEFSERRQRVEAMKREAAEAWQTQIAANQAKAREEFQEQLRAEQAALLEKLPEWRDEAKSKEEKGHLIEYLTSQGFSREDVIQAADHKMILLARKAMMFDRSSQNTKAALKKVAKVPKVMKPGSPKPPEQVNREETDKARQKLRQSGRIEDAFALLRAGRAK